ncbi:MAG: phage baseplate assembly protein V [Anaeromyxobacter sp.]
MVAIPATVQYRPPRLAPTPRITGLETAVIDGEADERYAQLDEHGRYAVRIRFDESDLGPGQASTRVRMLQPHGGSQEGFHFPLRKGTEVMLAFVGGDPDRPVIVGVGPNAHKPSPVTRKNATQNVIVTGGLNALVMEDTQGAEYVRSESPASRSFLHLGAPEKALGKNLVLSTDGTGLVHTGSDLTVETLGARADDVTGDLTETYRAAQQTTVHGAREDTVKGKVTERFEAGHEHKVLGGGVVREVTGGETEKVVGARTQTIEGAVDQTIKGAQTLTHDGPITQTVKGGVTQTVNPGNVAINVPAGTFKVDASGEVLLTSKTSAQFSAPEAKHIWPKLVSLTWTKYAVTAHAATVASLVTNLHGTKMDFNLLKVDQSAGVVQNTPAKFENVGQALGFGAFAIKYYALTILG